MKLGTIMVQGMLINIKRGQRHFGAILGQKITFLVILQLKMFIDLGRSMKLVKIMV